MALNSLANLIKYQTNLEALKDKDGDLEALFTELQGLTVTVVNGANANTNIAVTNIATTDTLVAVLEFTVATGNLTGITNRTSISSITSAGNIQITSSTATSVLVVVWYNKV